MKYKILFVDEEKNVLYEFEDYVERSEFSEQIEAATMHPLSSLKDTLGAIIKLNPDAIISDFRLNEKKNDIDYNVPYTGVELIEAFQDIRDDFPCFVMTSFDDDAMIDSKDVNKIYIKEILHRENVEQGAQVSFLGRVIKQVDNYKSRVSDAEEKLQNLVKLKVNNEITLDQEEELVALDSFIEKSINKRDSIPKNMKKISNEEKLYALLSKTDTLLDKLGKLND